MCKAPWEARGLGGLVSSGGIKHSSRLRGWTTSQFHQLLELSPLPLVYFFSQYWAVLNSSAANMVLDDSDVEMIVAEIEVSVSRLKEVSSGFVGLLYIFAAH